MQEFLDHLPELPQHQTERDRIPRLVVRCNDEQGDELGNDRDHRDNRDDQQGDVGQWIAQHMGDSVVRDAAQTGLDEDQPIEQPDHRNGDHNQEQLHCADD